jgi:hypothetical protein
MEWIKRSETVAIPLAASHLGLSPKSSGPRLFSLAGAYQSSYNDRIVERFTIDVIKSGDLKRSRPVPRTVERNPL